MRFIGVTGHGTHVAAAHLRSLARVRRSTPSCCPYNHSMMAQPEYAADFEALVALCARARRRGADHQVDRAPALAPDETGKRFSWYEPIREPDALRRAVHWMLRAAGLLPEQLERRDASARHPRGRERARAPRRRDAAMLADAARLAIEPLFVRGVSDRI